jgi:hypothetical protein
MHNTHYVVLIEQKKICWQISLNDTKSKYLSKIIQKEIFF